MTRPSMIATVGFHTASVRVDGIELSDIYTAEWVSSFKEDSAITKDICRKGISGHKCHRRRLAAAERCCFENKSAIFLLRVNEAIFGQVKRTDTVAGARG